MKRNERNEWSTLKVLQPNTETEMQQRDKKPDAPTAIPDQLVMLTSWCK